MEPEFTDEELSVERARLEKMRALCSRQGEVDGTDAARSQLRAVQGEIAARRNRD